MSWIMEKIYRLQTVFIYILSLLINHYIKLGKKRCKYVALERTSIKISPVECINFVVNVLQVFQQIKNFSVKFYSLNTTSLWET